MGDHVTIKDVAKRAGVSITTVSFVLNKRPDVAISEAVRKRVREAARVLDYHPSAMAAGLAGKRTRNIGIVNYLDNTVISNLFYSFVVEGMIQEALARDYNVLFANIASTYGGYQDLPKIVREKNADGILFMRRVEARMVQDVLSRNIPVVLIDPYVPVKNALTIDIDNLQGGQTAVDHLASLGHRNIGFLTADVKRFSLQERLEGYQTGLEKNGIKPRKEWVLESPHFTFHSAYDTAREALARNRRLTALFCANDEMAAGALRAAREAGRRVPADLSVVGFDNITLCNYTDPPLTTVNVAKEYMGKLAVTKLIDLIERRNADARKERVPVELIVRGSTVRPGAR
jgi:DNA-binding LacI/PurR family transcriptional regulator